MKNEKQKMISGELYDPEDYELLEERREARRLTHLFNNTTEFEEEKRQKILEKLFERSNGNIYIEPDFHCDYGYNITVGKGFFANFNCVMLDVCKINIGENCFMGPGVHIYTVNHPLNHIERNLGKEYGQSVNIGNNVWIGGKSVINPGVNIGDNVVVASGSVITKHIPKSVLVGGNPVNIIKEI